MAQKRLNSLLAAMGLLTICTLSSASCEETTTNPPQEVPSNIVASDYLQDADNLTWIGRIAGSRTAFDTNGVQTAFETFDKDGKVAIGPEMLMGGIGVRPVYSYDFSGDISEQQPQFYLGTFDGEIIAVNRRYAEKLLVLPKNPTSSKMWQVSDEIPARHHSTLIISGYHNEYTNNAGKKYSNVLKASVSFDDSTNLRNNDTRGDIISGNIEVYFAKGIGPIEFDVKSFNQTRVRNGKGSRTSYSGKVSRKND